MIGLRIENTNKFVIIPDINYEIFSSYLKSFPGERAKIKDHGNEYIINIKLQIAEPNLPSEPEETNVKLTFRSEIAEPDLHDLAVCLHIYKDISERLQELTEDAEFTLAQQVSFKNMIKRVTPLGYTDAKKYLRKLSAYMDAFNMNFYQMQEVTDTRFSIELIFKNVTRSNLLLGNDVESEIYELLPY